MLAVRKFEIKLSYCTDWMVTRKGFESGKLKEKGDTVRVHFACITGEVGLRWFNWLKMSVI